MNKRYLILFLALVLLTILSVLRKRHEAANPSTYIPDSHGHNHYHGDGHDHSGEDLPDGPPTKSEDRSDSKEPSFTTTASGLQYQVLFKGDGPIPGPGDSVNVRYEGSTEDGTIFDTNLNRDPNTFPVQGVIKGWQEGLQLMPSGSRFRFIIPADLAYGERGHPPLIPPNATLYFDIELLSTAPPVTVEIKDGRIEMPVFSTRKIEPVEDEPLPACPE